MKKIIIYLIAVSISCLILVACNQNAENKNYDKEIVNDGNYVKVETENEKLGQYTYPALDK